MKVDKAKMDMAMARACVGSKDLAAAAEIPATTVDNIRAGRNVRPVTLGKVARALGVDPAELIEKEA